MRPGTAARVPAVPALMPRPVFAGERRAGRPAAPAATLWRKLREFALPAAVAVAAGLSVLLASRPVRAQQFKWGAVYQHWRLSEPASNIDTWMWPSMTDDAMFFTQVFSIEGSGSYMGLQQEGNGSRKVRFSIWNATVFRVSTVEGGACRPFGGEGVGMTCTIPYAWETGRWYRLRIRRLESDAGRQWWGAWVMDDAGRELRIGDIRAPGGGLITGTSSFNEYYGPAAGFACGRPPPSAVHVYQPLVDDDGARAAARGGSLLHCSGGRVTEMWNGELARLDLHTDRVAGPAPARPPVAIDLAAGADLVVHSPRTADGPLVAPEQRLTLAADVRNLGTEPAAATRLDWYRSGDSQISAADERIGSVPVAGLSSSSAASASIGTTAPAVEGAYWFGACVEPPGGERRTDNNCSTGVRLAVAAEVSAARSHLADIYRATGGGNWTNRTNWLSDRPVWTWHGVETDDSGRVTGLKLQNNNLTGRIPDALSRLSRLEDLRLADNRLTGPVPAWLETLPSLRQLWLNSNRLLGPIPAELGALTRLGHLSLDRNEGLAGSVPAEFGNLTGLWTLRLNHTALTGPLPPTLTNLRALGWLDVRDTGLCAPRSAEFQSWLRTVRTVNGGIAACDGRSNRPPAPAGALAPLTIRSGRREGVEVGTAFRDPDGDRLTYGATTSAPAVATVAVSGSTVTVTAVAPGTATVTVTATDGGGSNSTAVQTFAVTVVSSARFTDDPLVPGVTPVKAVHFAELRSRVDALRRAAGLGSFPWTDPVLTAGVTPVRRAHLLDLRRGVAEVYAAAGRAAPGWTNPAPAAGSTPIRAAHLTELRAAVLALE